ncbi:MAG TPA: ATP cone domain-containing protein, partial [Patescibacteria group bacterium]|nr:ATP cone domain-containing protein [Patescibacteria group bacterium]
MVSVLKANKEKEPFNEEKLIHSIKRAGIPDKLQTEVLSHIKQKLYEGIPTSEIYRHILEFLDTSEHPYSRARYSLKEAIMMLGPTGYPFEDFVARLFELQGYEALVRQTLRGKCITHEIDVLIEKDGKKEIIEAKFHNHPGT